MRRLPGASFVVNGAAYLCAHDGPRSRAAPLRQVRLRVNWTTTLSFRADVHFQIVKFSMLPNTPLRRRLQSVPGARRSDAHVSRGDCLVVVGDAVDYRGFVSLHSMIGRERPAPCEKTPPSTGGVTQPSDVGPVSDIDTTLNSVRVQ
jgi:hypothetical protein